MSRDPMEHYRAYAKAHRKFQSLPENIRMKYPKFAKAGIGLIEFINLHEKGKLDNLIIITVEKETEKEQEE